MAVQYDNWCIDSSQNLVQMIVTIYTVQANQVPIVIQDGRQISKMAATKFSFFVISTSDGGDFPCITEIAFY